MSRMQKHLIQSLIIVLSLLIGISAYSADSTDSTIERLINQIDTMFPPVEGYVVSVVEDELMLDLKRGDSIKIGNKLKLIRYGEMLYHPVTNKQLGRKEKEIGEVEVLNIGTNFTRARIFKLKDSNKVQKGDGVRLPFKEVSFLVSPIKTDSKSKGSIDSNKLILSLEKKLKAHPRFDVPSFDLGVWLLDNGITIKQVTSSSNLKKLKRKVIVDYLLVPEVREVQEKTILGYELISAKNGKTVKRSQVLTQSVPKVKQGDRPVFKGGLFPGNQFIEFLNKQVFGFEIVDFAIGDVNGNGNNEFVIIDRFRVMIYKFQDNKFRRVTQVKTDRGLSHFLSVDVADINGNGIDEIFVTNQNSEDSLGSFVLEADKRQRKMVRVWDDVNLYFRVIRPFDEKPTLLAQNGGFTDPFQDGIKILESRNGNYQKKEDLKTPDVYGLQFILYGLTQTRVNSRKPNKTIILDKDYHLRVYSPSGRLLEKSDDYYGHDPRILDLGVKEDPSGAIVQGKKVRFRGRLNFEKFGKGRFLFIPKNYRLGGSFIENMTVIQNSSLVIKEVTRAGFVNYAETPKQTGYISGFQINEVPEKNLKQIHVANVDNGGLIGSFIKDAISTIYTYNWKHQ